MFSPKSIEDLYKSLSSLYKNPTRGLAELAALNVDLTLIERQQKLLQLFLEGASKVPDQENRLKVVDPSLYYKTLSLIYEIDDYRGAESAVRNLIMKEGDKLLLEIRKVRQGHGFYLKPTSSRPQRETFITRHSRSYWKARVICCVATVESRRRDSDNPRVNYAKSLPDLARHLELLESFVKDHLHREDQKRYAWTTLAFVYAAQARIARQGQEYSLAEQKLLEAIECLDGRAEQIRAIALKEIALHPTTGHLSRVNDSSSKNQAIEELKDDLVSIRRKQTLISFFNVALVATQRGFLRTANKACLSARLQFRLHGHYYHGLFNELVILSIKRARTSREQLDKFRELRSVLRKDIISYVKPGSGPDKKGNRKLYLYALRELALLHSYCRELKAMLKVLNLMEKSGPTLSEQWQSRVYHQRGRAYWLMGIESGDATSFQKAREHSNTAFEAASGCHQKIENYGSAQELSEALRRSKRTNLIETIESLITYGSIQVSAGNFDEAIKSAEAIIQYCDDDNPRLLAMGYLVRAEAYVETDRIIEAKGDVAKARILQRRIDHKYVSDRMRAIEKRWLNREDYIPLEDLKDDPEMWKKAQARLKGWAIDNHTNKKSTNEIAGRLGMQPRTVESYLQAVKKDKDDPYHHLGKILSKSEKIRAGIKRAKRKKSGKQSQDNDKES